MRGVDGPWGLTELRWADRSGPRLGDQADKERLLCRMQSPPFMETEKNKWRAEQ